MSATDRSHEDLYARITAQIASAVGDGPGRCELPWHGQQLGLPRNLVSRRPYRGVNTLVLWLTARSRGYGRNEWATFNQWRAKGLHIRRGEKATTVVFWKNLVRSEPLEDEPLGAGAGRGPLLARAYSVFCIDQVEGAEPQPLQPLPESERDRRAERFFAGLDARVQHDGSEAYYDAKGDSIHLPAFARFKSAPAYYATRAHETVHWSGAKHRLDRDLSGRFGTQSYAMEELVAELGAAFICAELGVPTSPRDDHAPYVASWLRVMTDDPRAIFTASSKAQQAADWLLRGMTPPTPPPPAMTYPERLAACPGGRRLGGPRNLYI
jgi:antirestriction protein ArdC